ncbi:MAG TPA: carboxypeptidase-like regulatory domain-containing protein [Acidimicrobiales bacterium]|jgi:hypothetical protein|nr:carboxypeptidase-like regulatory domain-containing protein [Acidimicrobiales bacterium]
MRRTVLLLLALVAVGCTTPKPVAAPPDTTPVTESTLAPSSTTTTAKPTTTSSTVPRTTVTTVLSLGPGDAALSGTVTGPSGPVDGATVHIERLVGKSVASQDVTTVGGSWQLTSILGGAYRVRAFKSPDLAQSDVQTFFLAANDRKVVDFKLAAAGGDRITAVVNPSPPHVGLPATVTITVGVGAVDSQGRAALTPRAGVVLILSAGQGFVVDSVPQVVTDTNGAASWSVHCTVEGATSLPLTVGTGVTSVNLPACAAATVAATTTTKVG